MLFEDETNMMNMESMNEASIEHCRPQTVRHPDNTIRGKQVLTTNQLCLLSIGLTLLVIVNVSLLLWVWLFILNLKLIPPTTSTMSTNGQSTTDNIVGLDANLLVSGGDGGGGMNVANIRQGTTDRLLLTSPAGISVGPSKRSQSSLKADNTWLELGNGRRTVVWSDSLKVLSVPDERLLMNVNQQITAFGFEHVLLKSPQRLRLNHSIQTGKINHYNSSLQLISQNRRTQFRSPKSMILQTSSDPSSDQSIVDENDDSVHETTETPLYDRNLDDPVHRAGKWIELAGTKGVHFNAGRVILSTDDVLLGERLLTVHPSRNGRTYPTVGQLCVCARSGLVFASHTHSDCLRSGHVCDQNQ